MAATKRVDVKGERGLQGAVLGQADLQGYAQQHVDHVGLVLVALQRQQHPLPPRRVEPVVEAHVVADEDGVHLQPPVRPLQEVAQLQVLEVRLEAQVVLRGVGHHGPAGALAEHVAGVAAAAAGMVVAGAGGTGASFADGARGGHLAGGVLVGTDARVELLGEGPQLVVLGAVEKGLEIVEPVRLWPAENEGDMHLLPPAHLLTTYSQFLPAGR